MKLTLEKAQTLLATTTDEEHLIVHALNVRGSMEAFARHFNQPPEEVEHWGAVGYLHDYDYQRFPSEHLAHTEAELRAEGVDEADIRAILSHGWMLVNDVTPQTDLEKSLYCADELSGLVWATTLMRPSRSSRTRSLPPNVHATSSGVAWNCFVSSLPKPLRFASTACALTIRL